MARVEIIQNTPEQVREYIQGALDVLSELEIEDELRVPVFQSAVALLSAKQVQVDAAGLRALSPERLAKPA